MSRLSQVLGGMTYSNPVVEENPAAVFTARQPASAYFTINSRDRYFNAQPNQTAATYQPWNNFTLQKAQSLVPAFAKRIGVSEVRFPWFIPNINQKNDLMYILLQSQPGQVYSIQLDRAFYTPAQVVAALNQAIANKATLTGIPINQWPVFGLLNQRITVFAGSALVDFAIAAHEEIPTPSNVLSLVNQTIVKQSLTYENKPSLCRTLGIPFNLLTTDLTAPKYFPLQIVGFAATTLTYTDFVDIVSDKLSRFTDARDGGSGDFAKTSLLMRIYCADETSMFTTDPSGNSIYPGNQPFVLHRQFPNPKQYQWEPKSFIGDIDIQVYDQYGFLVPLDASIDLVETGASYPEFQITMLASEQ